MSDLIERHDAEQAIDKALERMLVHSNGMGAKILCNVPSVTQKTGRWIFNGFNTICSECGSNRPLGDAQYCRTCGAKMSEE